MSGIAKAERAADVTARDPLEIDQLGGPINLEPTPSVRDFQAAPLLAGLMRAVAERKRIPNRRAAEVVEFVHDNRRWTATIGCIPDGRKGEIFLDIGKVETLGEIAQDCPIVASLALQHGCSIETLKSAIAGRSVGALGAALAMIEVETGRRA